MSDKPDEETSVSDADAIAVGRKVIEMAERLDVAHACAPGSVARWGFNVDDRRYELSMVVSS